MEKARMRIAVVGCGTAGPAAATLLARHGHQVTLYERAPECQPVGAGFLLQPSGMAVLEELGIAEAVLAKAAKVDSLHIVNPDGTTLLELLYREMDAGAFGAGLHRPVLLHHLMSAMGKAGVDVRWNHAITSAEETADGWRLTFSDGAASDPFDLLILADGARSSLRHLVDGGVTNRGYPWGAHWFIGENRGVFPGNELYQVVNGTRQLGGFLATGCDLDHDEPLVSLFWSIRIQDDGKLRSQTLDEWKRPILALCPRAEVLLDQIHDWSQIATARYGDVRMRRWYGRRIVVLGDAAHAMSPQLGQGVNLALADASCLADCISREPLPEALREYQRRRWPTIRYYQFATRRLTPFFQSDMEWITPFRQALFRVSQSVPPLRCLMTRTMAGVIGAAGER
ncbi:MAG: FAD-dependent monooxygenase [Verrucomicrobiaceae bacterium]|nr:MAG: FAD-dependent monooxygenase [Verrucomicrobiaceae bacterium]